MEAGSISFPISGLMCDERSNGVDERLSFGAEIDEEYVEMLIQKEVGVYDGDMEYKGFGIDSDRCSEKSCSWVSVARLDAVNWILNVGTLIGFQFSTVYLAITYFDQFFARQSIDNDKYWAVRLLSVACLSVAAKMKELNVPALSDYPMGEYVFEKSVIQRMELLLLSSLDWKMSSITPFSYLDYFGDKFCGDCESKLKNHLLVKATKLVLEMLQEKKLMSCRPSSIAAAAVLAAADYKLNETAFEAKLGFVQRSRPLKNDEVFSLYKFVQEIEKKKCKTPELDILPSRSRLRSPAVDEKFAPSTSDSKRKLSFDDNNDHQKRWVNDS